MKEFAPGNQEWPYEAVEQIGYAALMEVTIKYGDGQPDTEHVPTEQALAYHNMLHTMDVRAAARKMARALGLDEAAEATAVAAASAHDFQHHGPRGVVEQASADWLMQQMTDAGVPDEDIQAGRLAVLGTEPIFTVNGEMIDQRVNLQEYPSERAALIAATVACADMAGLTSAYGPWHSRKLYQERQGVGPFEEPPMEGMLAFQKVQLQLLQDYRFPHPVGEQLFGGLRREVLAYQIAVTQALYLGEITTWAQLQLADQAFAERYC